MQVAKHTKSRKTTYATIELFTLKHNSEVINDVLELPSKGDKVLQIAWEPNGHRFAVIHGELAPGQKQSVSFYTMMDKTMKQGAKLLGTVGNRYEGLLIWCCFCAVKQRLPSLCITRFAARWRQHRFAAAESGQFSDRELLVTSELHCYAGMSARLMCT